MTSLWRAFMRRDVPKPDKVPEPDFKALLNVTHFTKRELRKLFTRFCLLCNTETGLIERLPFVQQAEFANCPLISLAFEYECREQKKARAMQDMALGTSIEKEIDQVVVEEGDDAPIDIYNEKPEVPERRDSQSSTDGDHKDSDGDQSPVEQQDGGPPSRSEATMQDHAADGLDFEHFVKLLSQFSPKARLTEKATCKCPPNPGDVMYCHVVYCIDNYIAYMWGVYW